MYEGPQSSEEWLNAILRTKAGAEGSYGRLGSPDIRAQLVEEMQRRFREYIWGSGEIYGDDARMQELAVRCHAAWKRHKAQTFRLPNREERRRAAFLKLWEGLPLTPWQRWVVEHAHCGGKFETVHGRKGPRVVCSCGVERT